VSFEPPFEPAREVDTDSLPKAKSEGFGQSEGAASMPMRSQTRATAGGAGPTMTALGYDGDTSPQ